MKQKRLIDYQTDFLEYCEVEKGLRPLSVKNYSRFLDAFFDWLKQQKLDQITPDKLSENHIWQFRLFLSRRRNEVTHQGPLKPSTQAYYLIALRALLAFFSDRNIESLGPEKVKLPKEDRGQKIKFLGLDQIKRLLEAPNTKNTTGLRDRAVLEALFSTGLRISELSSLDRALIQPRIEGGEKDLEVVVTGKGGYTRTVYFSERATHWLKNYLKTRKDDDKALFINYRGRKSESRRLTPRSAELMMHKYSKIAGIPFLATPHTLPHT